MDPLKLIAYARYTTVGGALAAVTVRNCSLFYNGIVNLGDVIIRVGTPGPLTAANTPASLSTEWSRSVQNVLPIVVLGTAARTATIVQIDDTTYNILATDFAGTPAESAVWFALYTLLT